MKTGLIEQAAFLGRLRKIFKVISWAAVVPMITSAALAVAIVSSGGTEPAFVELTSAPSATGLSRAQLLTFFVALGLFILAALVWLAWVYFATRFLRIAGVERLHHGPLAAVAMHFIPVVSYVMPMLIMSELERATRDPTRWRYLDSNFVASTSWLTGKLAMIAVLQGVAFQKDAETPGQYASGLWLVVVAALLSVAGVYLFNRFLTHMERLQTALAAERDAPQTTSVIA